MTNAEELHRELLQARNTSRHYPREHFFASFSSTAYLELGLWRNVIAAKGRNMFRSGKVFGFAFVLVAFIAVAPAGI
jgi:hypothetical protein